jgi:Zn-dependent oligopeptidase
MTRLLFIIPEAYINTHFIHIVAGAYKRQLSSGYYGYQWSEIIDTDAFEHFRQKRVFNQ